MRILHHRWPLLWLCALVLLVGGAGLLWRCAHADPPAPPTLPPARTQRVARATTPAAAQARLAQQPALRGARWQALDWARVEAQLARLSPYDELIFRDPSPDGRYLLLLISFQPEAPEGDRRAAVVELPALTLRLLPTPEGQPPTPYYSVHDAVWDPQAPATLYQNIDQLEPPARDTGPTSQVWRQDIEGGPAVRLCDAEEEMRLRFVMPRSRQLCASAHDPNPDNPGADYRVLLALDPPAARTRPEWPWYYSRLYQNNISPDEQYLYGTTDRGQETPQSTLLFYERATRREVQAFNETQALFTYPPALTVDLPWIAAQGWLPDSSGLLLCLRTSDEQGKQDTVDLWQVTVQGEAQHLCRGVQLLASSANGRHWLLKVGAQYGLLSVPLPEEAP